VSLPGFIGRLYPVVVDEIGHALAGQRIRRSLDLEVDMRLARISGVSNLRQGLTAPDVVSDLYEEAAWLQVTVGGELMSAQLKHDVVTEHRVRRHFNCGSKFPVVSRHIVGKTIPQGHYRAICDSQHGLSVSVVRAFIACVSRERLAVLTLLPIDCEAARN
jgi:hypothetical protein